MFLLSFHTKEFFFFLILVEEELVLPNKNRDGEARFKKLINNRTCDRKRLRVTHLSQWQAPVVSEHNFLFRSGRTARLVLVRRRPGRRSNATVRIGFHHQTRSARFGRLPVRRIGPRAVVEPAHGQRRLLFMGHDQPQVLVQHRELRLRVVRGREQRRAVRHHHVATFRQHFRWTARVPKRTKNNGRDRKPILMCRRV